MQRKAMIKCKNLLGNTLTQHALSEIENETAERNSRSKIEKGFAWQIRRPRAPLSGNLLCRLSGGKTRVIEARWAPTRFVTSLPAIIRHRFVPRRGKLWSRRMHVMLHLTARTNGPRRCANASGKYSKSIAMFILCSPGLGRTH